MKANINCISLFSFIYALIILYPTSGNAQLGLSHWHMGNNEIALHFGSEVLPAYDFTTYYPFSTAGSSVFNRSDNGEMNFYTDGRKVIDKTHTPMPNGSGLVGGSATHGSGKIVIDPAFCNLFYVFSISTATENQFTGNLYYSKVDLNLVGNGTTDNPYGDVLST